MDDALRAYRRKLQAGEGDLDHYLQLLERSGQATSLTSTPISDYLHSYHSATIRKYILNGGTLDFASPHDNGWGFDYRRTPILDLVVWLVQHQLASRALIICPVAHLPLWQGLLQDKGLNYKVVFGARQSEFLIEPDTDSCITLVSYGVFTAAAPDILEEAQEVWPIMICDEIMAIKSPFSARHKAVVNVSRKCRTKWRIGIISSAITRDIQNIYAIYRFIQPDLLPDRLLEFRNEYMKNIGGSGARNFPQWVPQESAVGRLLKKIESNCVDVSKIP